MNGVCCLGIHYMHMVESRIPYEKKKGSTMTQKEESLRNFKG